MCSDTFSDQRCHTIPREKLYQTRFIFSSWIIWGQWGSGFITTATSPQTGVRPEGEGRGGDWTEERSSSIKTQGDGSTSRDLLQRNMQAGSLCTTTLVYVCYFVLLYVLLCLQSWLNSGWIQSELIPIHQYYMDWILIQRLIAFTHADIASGNSSLDRISNA